MRRVVVALVALVLAAAAHAATPPAPKIAGHPDFSGRWELDVARTDWGLSKARPRKRVDVVRHREPSLTIDVTTIRSEGDTVRYTWRYATDGSETRNKMMGQDVTSIGEWRGDTLSFDSSARVMMAEFSNQDRWSLSADLATLTIRRHNDSPMGKSDQRFVFVRKR